VSLPRALANLQRRLAFPTYDTARKIDALLAARLTAYVLNQGLGDRVEGLEPSTLNPKPSTLSPHHARRSPHLRTVASQAAEAAAGGGTGEHEQTCVAISPPFEARTAARVRPSGEGGNNDPS